MFETPHEWRKEFVYAFLYIIKFLIVNNEPLPSLSIPPMSADASNLTTSGVVLVERQLGIKWALRPLWDSSEKKSGLGSTRRPVHWKGNNNACRKV